MMAGFLKSLNGAQKKQLAAILSRESDDPDAGAATEPVTPAEPVAPTSTVGEEDNGEGVGEVTQTANETVVEANGLTITISDDASAAPEAPATEPAAEEPLLNEGVCCVPNPPPKYAPRHSSRISSLNLSTSIVIVS